MREIDSTRRKTSHSHLNSDKVKEVFLKNIKDKCHSTESAYSDGKSDKKNSIKWTLKHIYYEKCAFCESYIKNEVGDIEHFRPKNENKNQAKKCDKKNSYYWLAFSWDNLLPACSKCNGKKSNCFDIEGRRVEYKSQRLKKLTDLQLITQEYNKIEKPKLLHPEYDKFEDKIEFNNQGEIISNDEKVKYTVKICDLNRKNLTDSRESIINDFINDLKKQYIDYLDSYSITKNFDEALKSFKYIIKKFIKEANIKYQYSLVRKYIVDNFEIFLNDINWNDEDERDIIFIAFNEFYMDSTNE